jgi:hypothetical protein
LHQVAGFYGARLKRGEAGFGATAVIISVSSQQSTH